MRRLVKRSKARFATQVMEAVTIGLIAILGREGLEGGRSRTGRMGSEGSL